MFGYTIISKEKLKELQKQELIQALSKFRKRWIEKQQNLKDLSDIQFIDEKHDFLNLMNQGGDEHVGCEKM